MAEPKLGPSAHVWSSWGAGLALLGGGVYAAVSDQAWLAFLTGFGSATGLLIGLIDWRHELDETARRMGWI